MGLLIAHAGHCPTVSSRTCWSCLLVMSRHMSLTSAEQIICPANVSDMWKDSLADRTSRFYWTGTCHTLHSWAGTQPALHPFSGC
jgi:hypothetical protein